MEENLKEVRFDLYCKWCDYWNKKDQEKPCCDCLAVPANENSRKPVKYSGKFELKEEDLQS